MIPRISAARKGGSRSEGSQRSRAIRRRAVVLQTWVLVGKLLGLTCPRFAAETFAPGFPGHLCQKRASRVGEWLVDAQAFSLREPPRVKLRLPLRLGRCMASRNAMKRPHPFRPGPPLFPAPRVMLWGGRHERNEGSSLHHRLALLPPPGRVRDHRPARAFPGFLRRSGRRLHGQRRQPRTALELDPAGHGYQAPDLPLRGPSHGSGASPRPRGTRGARFPGATSSSSCPATTDPSWCRKPTTAAR